MSKTTLGFIFTGLIYLLMGVTLGVLFLIWPELRALKTVHAHLNLVGFVMFLIFGVAYHILPRFRGRPLHSESLAWHQFLMANIGLVGLLLSMTIATYQTQTYLTYLQAIFGSVLVISMYIFVYNMIRTLAPPVKPVAAPVRK